MTDEDWETLAGCIGDSSAAAIRGLVENKWIQRQILHIPDRDLAWRAWQELIEAVQFSEDQGLIFRPWRSKQ